MKKKSYWKYLAIGIMILFIGAGVIPGIGAKNFYEVKLTPTDNKQVEPLFEGNTYFILLSDYTDGAGQDNKWAVQLRFDSGLGVVESEFDSIQLPLILDQWVEIRVDIDLDNDWMEIYYNGDFLLEKAWTAGHNNLGDGLLNIGAVDLFANGATSVYYDDLSLEEQGVGVVWSENFDSYTLGSSMHGQGGWKGWDNDPAFTAYVTDTESLSTPHSVDVVGDVDLVHEYSDYTTGYFVYTAWQYLPSTTGEPPGAPVIQGTASGDPGTEYDYVFNAVDPDGDDVKYHIDWGDDTSDETALNPSGTDVIVPHTWAKSGNYVITAYAEDANGLTGPSSTFQVTMPRNKATFHSLLLRFLERFPLLVRLVRM